MKPYFVFIESNTSGTGRIFAQAAKDKGFNPVLLAGDISRYHYAKEDNLEFIKVNTQNETDLLNTCKKLKNVAGVLSSSEYFIEMAAIISKKLNLPGVNPDAIKNCRDKSLQRIILQENNIGIPKFYVCESEKESAAASKSIGYPVIVKPVMGTGSVGVKLCININEVAEHTKHLLKQKTNERGMPVPQKVLVEEFLDGEEYSVETFGGKIIGITKKYVGSLPNFVEIGHDFPADIDRDKTKKINKTTLDALDAVGLDCGPGHVEVKFVFGEAKIVEINPRLAGGFIPKLVDYAFGVNLINETIKLTSGERVNLESTRKDYSSIRFILSPRKGLFSKVEGLDNLKNKNIVETCIYKNEGNEISVNGDFRDRIGHIISYSKNKSETISAANSAIKNLRVIVK
ncbi:ATP-grasp domain-containing protein [Candidatus Woesearchaeota archaeon]|nr:ATP-grasp domain-containing protein [Candidatus Woesearchaeota archaeon]